MTTNNKLRGYLRAYGPYSTLAYVRWSPSGDATQALTEAQGVTSVTRSGAGAYTINFASKPNKIIPLASSAVSNDTTDRNQVRIESTDAAAGTATVSHKSTVIADESSGTSGYVYILDVSTVNSTGYRLIHYPGTIVQIDSVLLAPISGADATITTNINGTPVTDGAITIAQSGSAAGDIDTATPTDLNVVAEGDLVTCVSDGASTGAAEANVFLKIQGSGSVPQGSDSVDDLFFAFVLQDSK